MKKTALVVLMIAMMVAGFSCAKKSQVKGVDIGVEFSEKNLTDNLMTDVIYTWKTTSEFEKLDQDYSVFVHFWHGANLLIQDDYVPEVPTSQWEANQEYTFQRRIYIPPFIDEFDPRFRGEETLRLSVGLHSPYDVAGKSKLEVLNRNYKVTLPPPDTPEVIYESGWYNLEIEPGSYLKQWRWTEQEARCLIDNPYRDALLVIRGGVNPEAVKDQRVIFRINDLVLDEFIPEESHFEKSYPIKKEMLGDGDEFHLIIATDKTFRPADIIPRSQDDRVLGIQIGFIYFR